MTVSLFVQHKVKDFATWKKMYDEGAPQELKISGILTDSVHRSLDDPNTVLVYHQFADASAYKAHMARMDSDEFREGPVKVGGVIPETLEFWVYEDV